MGWRVRSWIQNPLKYICNLPYKTKGKKITKKQTTSTSTILSLPLNQIMFFTNASISYDIFPYIFTYPS